MRKIMAKLCFPAHRDKLHNLTPPARLKCVDVLLFPVNAMLSQYVDIRSHLWKVGIKDMDDILLSFKDDKEIDWLKAKVKAFKRITFSLQSAKLSIAHTFVYIRTVAAIFPELPNRFAPTASIVNYVVIDSAISKLQKKSSSEPSIEEGASVLCLTVEESTTHEAEISILLFVWNHRAEDARQQQPSCGVRGSPFIVTYYQSLRALFSAAWRACGDYRKATPRIVLEGLMFLQFDKRHMEHSRTKRLAFSTAIRSVLIATVHCSWPIK